MRFEPEAGERVVARHWARMYRGGGWAGWRGRLTVTDRRLVFDVSVLGWGTHEEIPLSEVASATLESTLGLIPNRLRIVRLDGSIVDFITPARRRIVEVIEEARTRATSAR